MQNRFLIFAAMAACVIGLVSCETPAPVSPLPSDQGKLVHTIYVFSNGFHTGLVLARADLSPGHVPEAVGFPKAAFLEFGWGDRDYYPSRDPTIGMALSAALTPTPAVMHLAGLDGPPQKVYRKAEVLALRLSAEALDRLTADINGSFDRRRGGRAEAVAPGLYSQSHFYPARGEFHLFNTCNTWTALKLAAAGVNISPSDVMTADDLMNALRELPNVLNTAVKP